MKIDWFDFWLVFSLILLLFLLIGLIIRFFNWLKFRKELLSIKQRKINDIIAYPKDIKLDLDESFEEKSNFKQEIDALMKDVYFDLYDKNLSSDFCDQSDPDFGLEKLLDGKILNLIKEKDYLLSQKDMLILSIEERNKKTLKEIINKIFLILKEKDKILKEKDSLINKLKLKIQEVELTDLNYYVSQFQYLEKEKNKQTNEKQIVDKKHDLNDFVNVNFIDWK